MRFFIPAAGLGTRMNMQPHEAKEFLDQPDGTKMIDYALNLVQEPNDSVVITREAKKQLVGYLRQTLRKGRKIKILEEETDGYAETMLSASDMFKAKNVLILPDTRFDQPAKILQEIEVALTDHDLVFGVHEVIDSTEWGIIQDGKLYEKCALVGPPEEYINEEGEKGIREGKLLAWGLIGFKANPGSDLFTSLMFNEQVDLSRYKVKLVKMTGFKDISRGI